MEWQPITDLPMESQAWVRQDIATLVSIWREQRNNLAHKGILQDFLTRMRRRVAIETGVIERLYTIDRGVTRMLVEHGIDAALIPHGATDRPVGEVVALIRDQESAVERVFDFVGANRDLSTSFIKSLHQLLTKNQPFTEGVDQFGNFAPFEMTRGDWKKRSNNVTKKDGTVHEYCPPEQVASQMDQLVAWHLEHLANGVSPEIEAAWLHHRFTGIHPFEDGNGRVARNLATLIFLRAGWFPLVVLPDDENEALGRIRYLDALERADEGDLRPLINLFAESQKRAFLSALNLSESVIADNQSTDMLLKALVERMTETRPQNGDRTKVYDLSLVLMEIAYQEWNELRDRLVQTLQAVGYKRDEIRISVDIAPAADFRSGDYASSLGAVLRRMDISSDLSGRVMWTSLNLGYNGHDMSAVVVFHEIGANTDGVMLATPFSLRRGSKIDEWGVQHNEIENLAETPFTFSYLDQPDALRSRFVEWFQDVKRLALAYWVKSI